MTPVLNMSGLRVWAGCKSVRITQSAEYTGIVLHMPKLFPDMREYPLIMRNMLEYACIYLNKQSSEYARILNMSDVIHRTKSLYKLLCSYRDKDAFRTLSNI